MLNSCKGSMVMTVKIRTLWDGTWWALLLRVTVIALTDLLSAEQGTKLKPAGALDHSTAQSKCWLREPCPGQVWELSSWGLLTLMTVKFNCLHLTSNPSITAKQKHSWNNKRKQSLARLQSGTFVAVLMYKELREKIHRPWNELFHAPKTTISIHI